MRMERLPDVTPSSGSRGAGGHHADARRVDVELVRDDLRQRREDALADLDLAGVHFTMPSGRKRSHWPRRGLRARLGGRAGALIALHLAAARRTARTMRLCEPQRHSCGSRAARTAASSGDGSDASSAAARISMPETQ
jgi:hypothetical protein